MALLKAKQIDMDDFTTKFILYLNSHPTSKQYFSDLYAKLVSTTPTPSYVSDLSFSSITNTTVILSWSAITGATSYEVEVEEYANSFSIKRITGITTTTYTVTELNPSMTYDIKVRAII